MNTKQLIAAWYGALVAAVVLVLAGRSALDGVLAVGIVTGLLVYTFSAHSKAAKRTVLFAVGGPVLGLVLIGVISILSSALLRPVEPEQQRTAQPLRIVGVSPLDFDRDPGVPIPIDLLDVFDVEFERGPVAGTLIQNIVGRVTNRSDLRLTHLVVHLRLLSDGTVIDENDLRVLLTVPPGETRSFSGRVVLRPASTDSRGILAIFGRAAHDLEFYLVSASGSTVYISTDPDAGTSPPQEDTPR